ncbi:DUF6482 family protein [Aestuariibacter sp. AA17]|uniref:DUF6482 family protein n=1 Tax=Fluctibacter corallii TaxID=2984329 RepID=A0ABT3A8Z4_9ALTE|nr:DUF6482 family protein [Aestuariibacter sp. AA17]MCV2885088.1 DUF6482 family protein [Aestuariibacter sp. AA17]
MKLFIESIEGGTYLAATMDGQQKRLVRDKDDNPMAFHCLNEIKDHFQNDNFDEVWLKQSTPYDEMCGLDEKREPLEMQIEWNR